ncbi:biotin-dependent enzyme [Streptomyces sp. Ag109_O5-1]|uniref:biotin/lipoyl-containing protein n=1 Tax=Streptomyces sp. Ag109_O5-1 TaxID=1938851 RepID=UPI000F4FE8D7|nr:lipoyl domain-containing protein [Streptomyces sp. Ag109_O5-1]RPE26690.1 biotin-dependent enzyme [Streptomyces sp. Ag109_O5-1]
MTHTASRLREFRLPDMNEGITEAEIVRWYVRPGDTVVDGQIVCEIDTLKFAAELPIPFNGVVHELRCAEGETVAVGTVVITVADADAAAPPPAPQSRSNYSPSPDARARRQQELSLSWGVPETEVRDAETSGRNPFGHDAFHFGDRPLAVTTDSYTYMPYPEAITPAVSAALRARDFALQIPEPSEGLLRQGGTSNPLDDFLQRHLVLHGGPKWREAASTALAEDWFVELPESRTIDETFVRSIKPDVQTIHRQLMPVWEHKVSRLRVLQLEAPLGGSGLTLLDVVAGELRMEDLVFETAFDDPRVDAVLRGLTEDERRVAMAWAHPYADTWTEAARLAGAADPEAFGERVRRKLKRLGDRYTQRAAAVRKTEPGR